MKLFILFAAPFLMDAGDPGVMDLGEHGVVNKVEHIDTAVSMCADVDEEGNHNCGDGGLDGMYIQKKAVSMVTNHHIASPDDDTFFTAESPDDSTKGENNSELEVAFAEARMEPVKQPGYCTTLQADSKKFGTLWGKSQDACKFVCEGRAGCRGYTWWPSGKYYRRCNLCSNPQNPWGTNSPDYLMSTYTDSTLLRINGGVFPLLLAPKFDDFQSAGVGGDLQIIQGTRTADVVTFDHGFPITVTFTDKHNRRYEVTLYSDMDTVTLAFPGGSSTYWHSDEGDTERTGMDAQTKMIQSTFTSEDGRRRNRNMRIESEGYVGKNIGERLTDSESWGDILDKIQQGAETAAAIKEVVR